MTQRAWPSRVASITDGAGNFAGPMKRPSRTRQSGDSIRPPMRVPRRYLARVLPPNGGKDDNPKLEWGDGIQRVWRPCWPANLLNVGFFDAFLFGCLFASYIRPSVARRSSKSALKTHCAGLAPTRGPAVRPRRTQLGAPNDHDPTRGLWIRRTFCTAPADALRRVGAAGRQGGVLHQRHENQND